MDILYVMVFFLGALGFAIGPLLIAPILSPRKTRNTSDKTKQAIECGMTPIGDAWIKFDILYYLYALMFVAFAVDILFLFPVALIYKNTKEFGISDFEAVFELTIFIAILSLIILYAWRKGVFKWDKKKLNHQ